MGLIGKEPVAGKIEGKRKKRAAKDEIVGYHHQLNGHEFGQTPGDDKDREVWRATVHGVAKGQT